MNKTFENRMLPFINLKGQLENNKENTEDIKYVLVPSEQVLMTATTVPGKKQADWMQALPYVLEEELAQPVDDLFFAVYAREDSGDAVGKTHVAVVETDRLSNWIEELKAHGLEHAQLVPDCFLIPSLDDAWQHISLQKRSMVRTGLYSGFSGDHDWVLQIFTLIQKQQPDLKLNEFEMDEKTALPDLSPFGLRQGVFKPIHQSKSYLYKWRWPAAMLGIFLIVLLADSIFARLSFDQERQAYQQQTEALFKQMFPDTKRIVNIRGQTKANLLTSGSQSGAIGVAHLILALEPFFKKNLDEESIVIQKASWYKQTLKIELKAKNVSALQILVDALQQEFKVDLQLKKLAGSEGKGDVEGVLNVSQL